MTETVTAEMFRGATGDEPINDDLERANCPDAGRPGHFHCGWSKTRNLPHSMADRRDEPDYVSPTTNYPRNPARTGGNDDGSQEVEGEVGPRTARR